MADDILSGFSRPKRLASGGRFISTQAHVKREVRRKLKKVKGILKKTEAERTEDERSTLHQLPEVVKTAEKNAERQLKLKERVLEIEDSPDMLDIKCKELAQMLQTAKNAIVYTGAGISTAASIPDYRGPNGVWTLLKKGQSLSAQDLVDADPTFTHMCITKLFKEGKVKHLVSQNCDGLHVRSGFPRHSLSEVHGNMFVELCRSCKPQKECLRLFDVTERTAKGRHKTGRTCNKCGGSLCDSIVHFGEKGGLKSPYKWRQAAKAASKSDLIVCLGSSLKVLRCYPCLWRMDMRPEHRPKLVIVNLQWTPKDERSSLKISGRCDDVLKRVAHHLGIAVPQYHRETDPLFRLHTPVKVEEKLITSKRSLEVVDHKPPKQSASSRRKPPLKPQCSKPVFLQQQQEQPRSMTPEHKPYVNGLNVGSSTALTSTAPLNSKRVEDDQRHSENFLKTEAARHARTSVGHILNPVRLKLEEMLKSRRLGSKATKTKANGQDRQSVKKENPMTQAGSTSEQSQPASLSCLPSIQNFLPPTSNGISPKGNSHPQLRTLLNAPPPPSPPPPPLPPASEPEHDVFRVDLSTNPISITSTHCCAKPSSPDSISVCLSAGPGYFSAGPGPGCSNLHATSCSSDSNYARLMRRIQFDHSYCKNPDKLRPSSKKQNPASSPAPPPCSKDPRVLQLAPPPGASTTISGPSVIPVISSDIADLSTAHLNMSYILSDQEFLSAVQQVIGYLPANLNVLTSEDRPLGNGFDVGATSQDKVIVNLNSDGGLSLQSPLQPIVLAVQAEQGLVDIHSSVALSDSQPRGSVGGGGDASAEDRALSGCVGEIKVSPVKQKSVASVPGWFGKGLRVRRKRTY